MVVLATLRLIIKAALSLGLKRRASRICCTVSAAAHTSYGDGCTGTSTKSLARIAARPRSLTPGPPSIMTTSNFAAIAGISRCSVGLAMAMTANNGSRSRRLDHDKALAWGSASTNSTRTPATASVAATLMAIVVLPTPPLRLRTPMIIGQRAQRHIDIATIPKPIAKPTDATGPAIYRRALSASSNSAACLKQLPHDMVLTDTAYTRTPTTTVHGARRLPRHA